MEAVQINSKDYWAQRETEQLKHNIKDEAAYDRELKRIYAAQLDAIQKEIDAFYGKYANAEGISINEAKKRVSKLDIEAYERKAKRYVKEKDFSQKANEEMRLYNATMRINRLEMLKANIGLELIAGGDELEKFMEDILQGRTEDELKRQAGILGKTITNNAELANAIVNGSFQNAKFSDRIWMYQDLLKNDLGTLLQSGLIQGKSARALARDLKKTFDTTTYNAERLMRTELARVQTEAQRQSFKRNGFDMYMFIANVNPTKHGTCPICKKLDGKHFKVDKMMPGENAPPMHPHCRCSTAAYIDTDEYEAWLDHLEQGGTTEEWNNFKKALADFGNYDSIIASSSTTIAKAKRLSDINERIRVTNEAINAKMPVYAEDLRAAYKNVKSKDGCADVCLHGTQYYTEYEHQYILNTKTLAYIIASRGDCHGQNIRLLSCSTGKEDEYGNCAAQEIANLLGVKVYAPIDQLNIHPNGKLTVGKRQRLSEEEGFKWFSPKKEGGDK